MSKTDISNSIVHFFCHFYDRAPTIHRLWFAKFAGRRIKWRQRVMLGARSTWQSLLGIGLRLPVLYYSWVAPSEELVLLLSYMKTLVFGSLPLALHFLSSISVAGGFNAFEWNVRDISLSFSCVVFQVSRIEHDYGLPARESIRFQNRQYSSRSFIRKWRRRAFESQSRSRWRRD